MSTNGTKPKPVDELARLARRVKFSQVLAVKQNRPEEAAIFTDAWRHLMTLRGELLTRRQMVDPLDNLIDRCCYFREVAIEQGRVEDGQVLSDLARYFITVLRLSER